MKESMQDVQECITTVADDETPVTVPRAEDEESALDIVVVPPKAFEIVHDVLISSFIGFRSANSWRNCNTAIQKLCSVFLAYKTPKGIQLLTKQGLI